MTYIYRYHISLKLIYMYLIFVWYESSNYFGEGPKISHALHDFWPQISEAYTIILAMKNLVRAWCHKDMWTFLFSFCFRKFYITRSWSVQVFSNCFLFLFCLFESWAISSYLFKRKCLYLLKNSCYNPLIEESRN